MRHTDGTHAQSLLPARPGPGARVFIGVHRDPGGRGWSELVTGAGRGAAAGGMLLREKWSAAQVLASVCDDYSRDHATYESLDAHSAHAPYCPDRVWQCAP